MRNEAAHSTIIGIVPRIFIYEVKPEAKDLYSDNLLGL
jgi:hypothetical protein